MPRMNDALNLERALARKLDAVLDFGQQAGIVRDAFRALSPEAACAALSCVAASSRVTHGGRRILLHAVRALLSEPEQRLEVAAAAHETGDHVVSVLVSDHQRQVADPTTLRAPDLQLGRPVALGERKSLARGRNRELLQRLLRDPSAPVIAIALANPALTEADAVLVGSRRPCPADVLAAVFWSSKWVVRPQIQSALAQNPYSPINLALCAALQLPARAQREIARCSSIDTSLRLALSGEWTH